ncbi:MAG: hypothetical protein LBR70_07005 [Lactobacillaceae bacterium]|jgi:lipopolysaccharide export system protein LptA|nr:hypothetical protein [Lactobacillaceae bacterium]
MKNFFLILLLFILISGNSNADIFLDADKSVEIHQNEGKIIAAGNAKIRKEDQSITADKITSFYEKDKSGKISVDKIIAEGNVLVVSSKASVTADKGEYIPKEDIVKLYNNVTISQDGNIIKGDYAETNLKTGVSKLVSNKSGGRVSGVFKEKQTSKED